MSECRKFQEPRIWEIMDLPTAFVLVANQYKFNGKIDQMQID
jgi:hypothetical protein